MPKGTEDQVGFLAPQSKQILLASFRLSFSKILCDSVLEARAEDAIFDICRVVVWGLCEVIGGRWES